MLACHLPGFHDMISDFSPQYNPVYDVAVSADGAGMLEYWTGPKQDYKFPKNIKWEYKTDTDLYEFAKVNHISSNSSTCT